MRKIICGECRAIDEYEIKKVEKVRLVKGKEYRYPTMIAVCAKCGEELYYPELLDYDNKIFDEFYRKKEGIITVSEIECIIKKYQIEKRPLSIILGFGELTITRYLDGRIPSKKYSDKLYEILYNGRKLLDCLEENKNKITESNYSKYKSLLLHLEEMEFPRTKIEVVAQYIIKKMNEVTPLALQKLLYYSQAMSIMFYNKPLFEDYCEAWIHGPVYPLIYDKYKHYGCNVIEFNECYELRNISEIICDKEIKLLDCVINIFGRYRAKILEKMTHDESPWIYARKGLPESVPSNAKVEFELIEDYFNMIKKKYDMEEVNDIERYVIDAVNRINV